MYTPPAPETPIPIFLKDNKPGIHEHPAAENKKEEAK